MGHSRVPSGGIVAHSLVERTLGTVAFHSGRRLYHSEHEALADLVACRRAGNNPRDPYGTLARAMDIHNDTRHGTRCRLGFFAGLMGVGNILGLHLVSGFLVGMVGMDGASGRTSFLGVTAKGRIIAVLGSGSVQIEVVHFYLGFIFNIRTKIKYTP
jgi:hypothetical protein